nr:SPOR domain-containing protein [uncultured Rhodopila sp.]
MSDDLSIPNPGYRAARVGRYGAGQRVKSGGMDPDMRRMAIFAGGIGTVLVLLIGASALTSRHSGETPVVTADTRPIRVKPENPGGMKIDGAENDVFSAGADTGNAKLAPAAETPDTKAWRSAAASPAPAAAEAPAPAALTPPAAAPQKAAALPVVAKPQVAPPAPTKLPVAAATSGHAATVQLAALASEEAAKGEWQALSKRMPDLLVGHQPSYSRTEHDGHTFWRVRTSGFSDAAQARGFCDKVRAKGLVCSVTES